MKLLKLTSVVKTMVASIALAAASAGASPILADSERSLERIVCSLYMLEGTSCRQPFDGGDGQNQLWPMGVIEASDRTDEFFSTDRLVPRSIGRRATLGFATAGNEVFAPMSLNSGHNAMVAFRGDDDSILIGHYRSGPWSKNQFLRDWNNGRGPGGDGDPLPPIIGASSSLPEPSTLALLGLGLLGVGVLRRRTKS